MMKERSHLSLNLDDLAAAVGLSTTHLRRLFKRETGTSLIRYLKALRMEQAKRLLESSLASVVEIARIVGFKDLSHFARDFRERYGLPPSRYRTRRNHDNANNRCEDIDG